MSEGDIDRCEYSIHTLCYHCSLRICFSVIFVHNSKGLDVSSRSRILRRRIRCLQVSPLGLSSGLGEWQIPGRPSWTFRLCRVLQDECCAYAYLCLGFGKGRGVGYSSLGYVYCCLHLLWVHRMKTTLACVNLHVPIGCDWLLIMPSS